MFCLDEEAKRAVGDDGNFPTWKDLEMPRGILGIDKK